MADKRIDKVLKIEGELKNTTDPTKILELHKKKQQLIKKIVKDKLKKYKD